MNRTEFLLQGIQKTMLGVEIAPWFNPLVPKADGYNVRSLDVFDDATLMRKAKDDPSILPRDYSKLEKVDYVGSATQIAELIAPEEHGQFDYVLSSHNFEHLPNPIKFLQGCERLLKPGGILAMAVPDGRACFDYLRPHTVTADWLEAYLEDRHRPSPRQVFAGTVDIAGPTAAGARNFPAVYFSTPPSQIENPDNLSKAWAEWCHGDGAQDYKDVHCSVFTPASLQLLIEDCHTLGLINLNIDAVSDTRGVEFTIRLTKPSGDEIRPSAQNRAERRTNLLKDIWDEHSIRNGGRFRRPCEYVHRKKTSRLPWLYVMRWHLTEGIRRINRRRRMRRKSRMSDQS